MITINAMGDTCPIPVVKTKKAIEKLEKPDTIETLVDNEIAVENLKNEDLINFSREHTDGVCSFRQQDK